MKLSDFGWTFVLATVIGLIGQINADKTSKGQTEMRLHDEKHLLDNVRTTQSEVKPNEEKLPLDKIKNGQPEVNHTNEKLPPNEIRKDQSEVKPINDEKLPVAKVPKSHPKINPNEKRPLLDKPAKHELHLLIDVISIDRRGRRVYTEESSTSTKITIHEPTVKHSSNYTPLDGPRMNPMLNSLMDGPRMNPMRNSLMDGPRMFPMLNSSLMNGPRMFPMLTQTIKH